MIIFCYRKLLFKDRSQLCAVCDGHNVVVGQLGPASYLTSPGWAYHMEAIIRYYKLTDECS